VGNTNNINYVELDKEALIDLLRAKDLEILRYQSRINQLETLHSEYALRLAKKEKEKVFKRHRRVSDATSGVPETGQVIDAGTNGMRNGENEDAMRRRTEQS
jgi:hypothetical protein